MDGSRVFFSLWRGMVATGGMAVNFCHGREFSMNASAGISLILAAAATTFAAELPVDYNRQIRPLLSNHCFKCHGPDAAQRKAGFRLDVRESALAAAESGEKPLVPGEVAKSELVRRINAADAAER